MKLLIIIFLLAGCKTPNPTHLHNYLNYMQRQQHHMDEMRSRVRVPMRQAAPMNNNPYDPINGSNPYNPMNGY